LWCVAVSCSVSHSRISRNLTRAAHSLAFISCSLLQRNVVCCSELHCAASSCSVSQCIASTDSLQPDSRRSLARLQELQCVAVCCSVLQRVAVFPRAAHLLVCKSCNALQCVAVCCSVLQCIAITHPTNRLTPPMCIPTLL